MHVFSRSPLRPSTISSNDTIVTDLRIGSWGCLLWHLKLSSAYCYRAFMCIYIITY